jgi:hypothetical protein
MALTVRIFGKDYALPLDEVLQSLTGEETMMVEDFLGGWDKFRSPSNVTRSVIVIVWLAKRHAGEKATFAEIAKLEGLVFGDAVEVVDEDEDTPLEHSAATSPVEDSSSTQATSGANGSPITVASTG